MRCRARHPEGGDFSPFGDLQRKQCFESHRCAADEDLPIREPRMRKAKTYGARAQRLGFDLLSFARFTSAAEQLGRSRTPRTIDPAHPELSTAKTE